MSIIVGNTQGQPNTSSETDLVTEARFIQMENSKLLKIVGETERQLSIFKEGVLKLKQFYDMQMVLMKSHLHGEDEPIETFFAKLIKIMEFVKEMFLYLDSCCVDSHSNDSEEHLTFVQPRNSSQEVIPAAEYNDTNAMTSSHDNNAMTSLHGTNAITSSEQNVFVDDISSSVEVSEHLHQISTSTLSPQCDVMHTSINDDQQRLNHLHYATEDASTQNTANSSGSANIYLNIASRVVSSDEICLFCKNTFTTKRDLNRHMRRHTGEKPFRCEVCSKDFSRKDFLLKHKLTHTGEKPHSCSQCQKRFSQRSNLNKHLLTHTKNHRFTCKICRRGFHQMINLHRHEQLHCNTNKHFQCTSCSRVQYQGTGCLKTFLDKRDEIVE